VKQLSTIFLILIVLLQTFSRFVVKADFFLNRVYIAKVFCVNKEKPKMHCNGKCYLTRQLKAQEKQDQQAPAAKKSKIEVQLFNLSEPFQINICKQREKPEYLPLYLLPLPSFPHSVFHPPAV